MRSWSVSAAFPVRIVPVTEDIETDDPIAYVLSMNLHRRHLTVSQLGMVGSRAKAMYDEAAKKRMAAGGGDKKSEKAQKSGKKNSPYPIKGAGQSRDQAGAAVGVSGPTIDQAALLPDNRGVYRCPEIAEGGLDVDLDGGTEWGRHNPQRKLP